MDGFWRDLKIGFRVLGAAPVVTLSIALGIGANTAIFSLIDSMILRELAAWDAGVELLHGAVGEPEFELHGGWSFGGETCRW